MDFDILRIYTTIMNPEECKCRKDYQTLVDLLYPAVSNVKKKI